MTDKSEDKLIHIDRMEAYAIDAPEETRAALMDPDSLYSKFMSTRAEDLKEWISQSQQFLSEISSLNKMDQIQMINDKITEDLQLNERPRPR
jgi:hypothetical protein